MDTSSAVFSIDYDLECYVYRSNVMTLESDVSNATKGNLFVSNAAVPIGSVMAMDITAASLEHPPDLMAKPAWFQRLEYHSQRSRATDSQEPSKSAGASSSLGGTLDEGSLLPLS